ncbi:MAG: ribosomal protein S18-alanine N-acetyltransferase [Actinomycetota bacterium]|nr:ribosomal protein S18-alanine N-acetyltransferase [Actinomycetota bacterium]
MSVSLRRMRWWDVETVLPAERELFGHDAWSAETFWSELGRPDTRSYVVAEEDGDVVGYAGLLAVGATADVQTVAVVPGSRGRGIGRRLVTALLDRATGQGCTEVLLEVRADNDSARGLYESLGFERIAVRRGYYQPDGADAHVMRLRTAPTTQEALR